MNKSIQVDNAPAAIGPYSQGIGAGQTTYVSGQLPVNPDTGKMPEGIEAQTTQSLNNLKAVLAGAGMVLADVVKTTVFMADLEDFSAMNQVYQEFFQTPCPARSTVQVAKLPLGAAVEIECIAVR